MANFGLRVGSVTPRFFQSINISPSLITANTVAHETYAVVGLATDMAVHVDEPVRQTGIQLLGGRVSAVNTLELDWWNTSGGSITPTPNQEIHVVAF